MSSMAQTTMRRWLAGAMAFVAMSVPVTERLWAQQVATAGQAGMPKADRKSVV